LFREFGFRCQCSAHPPVKKTAGQIEKETSLEPNNLIMAIYEILIVGAASSRDYAMIAIKRLFFAAGSRSHEKLM
jgi:hypothetical protein